MRHFLCLVTLYVLVQVFWAAPAAAQTCDAPLDVVMLVDVSAGMQGRPTAQVVGGLRAYAPPNARIALIAFYDNIAVLTPSGGDLQAGITALAEMPTAGSAVLDQALLAARDYLAETGRDEAKKVVLVMTGGADADRERTQTALAALAEVEISSGVIGIGTSAEALEGLAADRVATVSADGLTDIFDTITAELRGCPLPADSQTIEELAASEGTLSGEMAGYGLLSWLIEVEAGEPLAVVVEGAGTSFSPELDREDGLRVVPTLALTRLHDMARTVTVFVPDESGHYSLTVQSYGDDDEGTVNVRLFGTVEQVMDLLPVVRPDGAAITVEADGSYALMAEEGTTLTVQTQPTDGRLALVALFSSDGTRQDEVYTALSPEGQSFVYRLRGEAPYWITVSGEAPTTLAVLSGDRLRDAGGTVEIGVPVMGEPESALASVYTTELAAGTYTLTLTGDGYPDLQVHTTEGERLLPEAFATAGAEQRQRYQLVSGSYSMTVTSGQPYTLLVEEGDGLTVDRGGLVVGDVRVEAGIAPQTAIYTLDAVPGTVLTLELSTTVQPVTVRILDQNGREIYTQSALGNDVSQRRVYTLVGDSPYGVQVEAAGEYRIAVLGGDLSRLERAPIVPGGTLNDSLDGQTAVYALEAEQGQTLLFNVTGVYPVMALFAGDSPVLLQRTGTEEDLTQTLYLAELESAGPYRLELTAQGSFTLSLIDRGAGFPIDVQGRGINLRAGPGTQFAALAQTNSGDDLLAIGRNQVGDWIQVTRDDGLNAWISAPLVQPENSSDRFEDLPVAGEEIRVSESGDGVCTVTAINNVNLRAGAGTDTAVQGTLSLGSSAVANAQRQVDGMTWWQLESGTWVRGDTVEETAGCASLPNT